MSTLTLDDWVRGRAGPTKELEMLRMNLASERQAKIERGEMLCELESELTALRAQLEQAERKRDQWRGVAIKLADALKLNRNVVFVENEARHDNFFDYALEPADAALADFDRLQSTDDGSQAQCRCGLVCSRGECGDTAKEGKQ
jgi:hypothetical protein